MNGYEFRDHTAGRKRNQIGQAIMFGLILALWLGLASALTEDACPTMPRLRGVLFLAVWFSGTYFTSWIVL